MFLKWMRYIKLKGGYNVMLQQRPTTIISEWSALFFFLLVKERFVYVIDEQLAELNDRYDELNTKLIICLSCVNPDDSFVVFDK